MCLFGHIPEPFYEKSNMSGIIHFKATWLALEVFHSRRAKFKPVVCDPELVLMGCAGREEISQD